MPANPRVRTNNVFGTTTDNPLTNVATTMNSAGLANLAAIATQHAVITLDPLRVSGAPEYVIVTAHTGSATSATITRGAYGSTARQHPLGTLWTHAPLTEDFILICTSATRPSDPYEGQGIYETDTNKLAFYTGTDWAYRDAGGTLGYAQVTANQGSITTEVDLTSLTATVTVPTGRRIRVTGAIDLESTVAADDLGGYIYEGAGLLVRFFHLSNSSANRGYRGEGSVVLTPSAGAHTYKLRAGRIAGTGTLTMGASASNPAFILVEDIGAA